jgi:thiosulfate reductase cytochrome b subunit
MKPTKNFSQISVASVRLGLALLASVSVLNAAQAASPALQTMHPAIALQDAEGVNVLKSGQAVSTMKTCGQCHDTTYIADHAFHADLGLSHFGEASKGGLSAGKGFFGRWDPLRYRYLTLTGDELLDLSTPAWLMANGTRVVGGGPALTGRDGSPLKSRTANANDPEASLLSPDGKRVAWDWNTSGTMEMNCFLCHLAKPNLQARAEAINAGRFGDANTATLVGLGIVEPATGKAKGWNWNRAAFTADGLLDGRKLAVQDPSNANCAACHGEAHPGGKSPIQVSACDLDQPQTATTGQVISGQRIKLSGVNLANKDSLNRSWDVHAERQLQCTDCHHALNNPAHARGDLGSRPDHLRYDPRTVDIGQYLQKPDHDFARGPGARSQTTPVAHGEMRRCDTCHDASGHSSWLPYVSTHMAALACETCHIPQQYAPAIQAYDWTVLTTDAQPAKSCRGVQGTPGNVQSLVEGYVPVLLARQDGAETATALAPYNLITSFYWIYDDAQGHTRPVRQTDLQMAYFGSNAEAQRAYVADILSAFDADKDGKLSVAELRVDTAQKQEVVKARLQSLGLKNPRMDGQVQPYAINHGVARGEHVLRDCAACHSKQSRMQKGMALTSFAPVMPHMERDTNAVPSGELVRDTDGALRYQPVPARDALYVFGASAIGWVDALGVLAFLGTLLGVSGHGLLRFLAWRKRPHVSHATHPVQMYDAYRRFWHWLQAISIVTLLATGIVIHRPDWFNADAFPAMVTLHNILAVLLVVNAALSLFYHLATERMREYLPRPQGFIHDSMRQSAYYISGIFKGEPHPFEKRPDDRMNPIQKLTYFGILNVLLPLQIVTGALIWGAQYRPDLVALVGGLPLIAPLHALSAWFFATFIVGHIYLTTTGATPLEGIRAMVTGVEDIEDHA